MKKSDLFIRQRTLTFWAALIILLALSHSARAQTSQPITPFLDEIIVNTQAHRATAYFGYTNPNSQSVSIPISQPNNYFDPAPDDHGQPSLFFPGAHHYAFAAIFDYSQSPTIRWFLNNMSVTADSASAGAQTPQTTAFTYQGRLTDSNSAANGTYQMRFTLFDTLTNGTQIGSPLVFDGAAGNSAPVQVTNGVFTVQLDFGSSPFVNGSSRYLQVEVRRTSNDSYVALAPRQPITSSPYATRAFSAATADNATNATTAANLGGSLSGDVTGTQTATLINSIGGKTSAQVATSVNDTTNATPTNTASTIIKRDSSGNFAAGGVTASGLTVTSNAAITATQTSFAGGDGFVASGTFGSGSIPATGAGARMMWYPNKAAFRAGQVDTTSWDDANIGSYSIALGKNTTASNNNTTALGVNTVASGGSSTALGVNTTASGNFSTAMGFFASTNSKVGSFVYGDTSTSNTINATVNNQFVVRAQNFWFGQNNVVTNTANRFIETSTGAFLSTGGTWTNASSRDLKTNFAAVNSRDILRKVLQLPIQTWNYKAENQNIRHIGAMSQDFHRFFHFGDGDRSISTVDAEGVALAAIQGLHEELKDRDQKIEQLQQQLGAQQQQLMNQQTQIETLKQIVCFDHPQASVCKK